MLNKTPQGVHQVEGRWMTWPKIVKLAGMGFDGMTWARETAITGISKTHKKSIYKAWRLVKDHVCWLPGTQVVYEKVDRRTMRTSSSN